MHVQPQNGVSSLQQCPNHAIQTFKRVMVPLFIPVLDYVSFTCRKMTVCRLYQIRAMLTLSIIFKSIRQFIRLIVYLPEVKSFTNYTELPVESIICIIPEFLIIGLSLI